MAKPFSKLGAGALVAAVVALGGCAAQLPAAPAGIEQSIESASSSQDHEKIALEYERQAGMDSANARRHVGYAATYRKNRSPRSGAQAHEALAKHCEGLARTYQQAADGNLALAMMHRQLAGK
jgi:hypothetical protein